MMDAIPRGWSVAHLGDVFDILDYVRRPINASERVKRVGDVPYYGATGQVGWIDRHLFDEELILLGEDGAPFLESSKPKAYVIRGKSWVNNHAHVLRAPSSTPSSFWKHQLDIIAYTPFVSGTTRLKLPQARMKQIPLLVAPSKEQHRLAEDLDSHLTRLDDAVASLERVLAKLKAYRASVLKAAVEGRLVPTEAAIARAERRDYEPAETLLARILKERRRRWEERELARLKAKGRAPKDDGWMANYQEPVSPDRAKLPELPEGWCWASLDQLSHLLHNGQPKAPRENTGVRTLRISAVRPMVVDFEDVRYLPGKPVDYPNDMIEVGDLLFTRYNGTPSLVGVCGRVRVLTEPTVHPDKLIKVRLCSDLEVGFIELAANAGESRRLIEHRTRTTAGQAGISGSDLRQMPLPVPPLVEQGRIADEAERLLSVANETRAAVAADERRCARFRQAVLKWAFEGKLVDQDPNDEPAEQLLARIRAERAAITSNKKTRGRAAKGAA